ncbi:hypothetical protein ONZ45_g6002 [Pleurotus djamor]|nr:hypothetical protein ONZ45_g6002 [Pleurotus djamor]
MGLSQSVMDSPTPYQPAPTDVAFARRSLLEKLPKELVDKVLDLAHYWPCVTFFLDEESDEREVYARGSNRGEETILSVDIEPLSLSDSLSPWLDAPRVKAVEFVLDSHDQGWGGYAKDQGTYVSCWSWWEVAILRLTSSDTDQWEEVPVDGSSRFHLQNNVHVSDEFCRHKIYWTDEELPTGVRDDRNGSQGTGRGVGKGFVDALRMGDRIALIAVAQYPGWANHVRYTEVSVYYHVPFRLMTLLLDILYILLQRAIIIFFKPPSSKCCKPLSAPYGRIAVIGAGLTGVSSAAHAISHNFEVVIFEANARDKLGGIWAHVNRTSGLQLNSLLYRFHPAVLWSRAFPRRDEILSEITRVWEEYGLESRTRFNTRVKSIRPASNGDPKSTLPQWVINDGEEGIFNAVIVNVGTCGKPKWIRVEGMPEDLGKDESPPTGQSIDQGSSSPGPFSYADVVKHEPPQQDVQDTADHKDDVEVPYDSKDSRDTKPLATPVFKRPIIHSSQLDSVDGGQLEGKRIVVIGSGASGVEAVESALDRCGKGGQVWMIARSDKWIIPSFLWEAFLTHWHYRGVEDLVPADRGIFEGTPVVNDEFLEHVRMGRCTYIRGDPIRCTSSGLVVNARRRGSKPKDEGEETHIEADIIVLATGFERPNIDFFDKTLFPEGYDRPNLYLQNFSTEDWSILMTNSAYQNAIGTVGHV